MEVVVVGRRVQQRWRIATQLGPVVRAARPPDVAASRLAHPSTTRPDAVVLVVGDWADLLWLRTHTTRSPRRCVPVIAVLERPGLATAAREAGAVSTVELGPDGVPAAEELRAAVEAACTPAVVIDLAEARSHV